jgi:hypothetical protein
MRVKIKFRIELYRKVFDTVRTGYLRVPQSISIIKYFFPGESNNTDFAKV